MSKFSHKIKKSLVLRPTTRPTTPENGEMYYDQTLNTFFRYQNGVWQQIGSGSGGVGINYLPFGGDFDAGVGGWNAFNTTFTSGVPTTITMGSSKVAVSSETAAPLSGTGSLKFAVTTFSGSAGHGMITDEMEIGDADLARIFQASFDYWIKTNPQNFDLSGTTSSTFEMWVYNVGLASWYQPVGFRDALKSWSPDSMSVSFQSDISNLANKNKYQFAMIIKNAPTGNGDMLIDNAFFGRAFQTSADGFIGFQAYATTNHGAVANTPFAWDGSLFDSNASFNPAAGQYTFPETGYYLIGYNALIGANGDLYMHTSSGDFSGASHTAAMNLVGGGDALVFFKAGDTMDLRPNTNNTLFSGGFSRLFAMKVGGGEASVGGEGAVIRAAQDTGQSVPDSTSTILIWNQVTQNDFTMYNPSTGQTTIKVPGRYKIDSIIITDVLAWPAAGVIQLQAFLNGGLYSVLGEDRTDSASSRNLSANGTDVMDLKAGDVVDVRLFAGRSGSGASLVAGGTANHFSLVRVNVNSPSGAGQAIKTASAALSTNQAWPTNTHTIVALDTALYDTAGLLNLGSNGFTIKESGFYRVSGTLDLDNGTGVRAVFIVKNGTPGPVVAAQVGIFGSGFSNAVNYYKEMYLNAGDLIQADAYQDAGTGATIIAGCTMTVTKM